MKASNGSDLQGVVADPDGQPSENKKDSFVLGLIDQNGKKIARTGINSGSKSRKHTAEHLQHYKTS